MNRTAPCSENITSSRLDWSTLVLLTKKSQKAETNSNIKDFDHQVESFFQEGKLIELIRENTLLKKELGNAPTDPDTKSSSACLNVDLRLQRRASGN